MESFLRRLKELETCLLLIMVFTTYLPSSFGLFCKLDYHVVSGQPQFLIALQTLLSRQVALYPANLSFHCFANLNIFSGRFVSEYGFMSWANWPTLAEAGVAQEENTPWGESRFGEHREEQKMVD